MLLDEFIIINSAIDKLPLCSKEFKRSLKHMKEEISLDSLANHLCVNKEFYMQEEIKESVSKV